MFSPVAFCRGGSKKKKEKQPKTKQEWEKRKKKKKKVKKKKPFVRESRVSNQNTTVLSLSKYFHSE